MGKDYTIDIAIYINEIVTICCCVWCDVSMATPLDRLCKHFIYSDTVMSKDEFILRVILAILNALG